jgi:putative transposase
MISRRALLRQFTFRPDPVVEQIWLYSLAVYAALHGIDIHSFVLMSTHEHLNVTDTRGTMDAFLRDFHRTVAKALKKHLRIDTNIWEDKPCSVVHLQTLQAFVEKSGYFIANPVEAGAVERSSQWPGLLVSASEVGNKTFTIERPSVYFSPKNKRWPKTITLKLTMPKLIGDYKPTEVRELIAVEAERLEHEARKRVRAEGRGFMGAKKVKSASRFKRATTQEPFGDINPTFAVGRDNHEALRAAVLAVKEFRRLYRKALTAWRKGNRKATFPPGTCVMRWLHGANVATAA